jgi:hypothetical protein
LKIQPKPKGTIYGALWAVGLAESGLTFLLPVSLSDQCPNCEVIEVRHPNSLSRIAIGAVTLFRVARGVETAYYNRNLLAPSRGAIRGGNPYRIKVRVLKKAGDDFGASRK